MTHVTICLQSPIPIYQARDRNISEPGMACPVEACQMCSCSSQIRLGCSSPFHTTFLHMNVSSLVALMELLCCGWRQLVDAKEAGAAAVLGITMSVTGRGSSILSQYASALGMEAPVEVWCVCPTAVL